MRRCQSWSFKARKHYGEQMVLRGYTEKRNLPVYACPKCDATHQMPNPS